jgi:hypothetical protein
MPYHCVYWMHAITLYLLRACSTLCTELLHDRHLPLLTFDRRPNLLAMACMNLPYLSSCCLDTEKINIFYKGKLVSWSMDSAFCLLVLLTWESTSPLPCEGRGTAGVSTISYTGESKLGGIQLHFSWRSSCFVFSICWQTAYTAVVESVIMNLKDCCLWFACSVPL